MNLNEPQPATCNLNLQPATCNLQPAGSHDPVNAPLMSRSIDTRAPEPQAPSAPARGNPHPQPTARLILLLGLFQGLIALPTLVLLAYDWWPVRSTIGRFLWDALVITLLPAMMLMVNRLRDLQFWKQVRLLAALGICMIWQAGQNIEGAEGIDIWQVLVPCLLSVAAFFFLILPFLQQSLRHARWRYKAATLSKLAWQNSLCLLLGAASLTAGWLVLLLCATVLDLFGSPFLYELFTVLPFSLPLSGLMLGAGIALGRTRPQWLQHLRSLIGHISRLLLPVSSLLCASLALWLVLSRLSSSPHAAVSGYLLMPLIGLTLLLNTTSPRQENLSQSARGSSGKRSGTGTGAGQTPGGSTGKRPWLIHSGLISLPVLSTFTLYGLWLRMEQHGLTQMRLAGLLLASLLGLMSIGYLVAALRTPGRPRPDTFRPVNLAASVTACALLLLTNLPVLNLHRITAETQLARLQQGAVSPAQFDLAYLRFKAGSPGVKALRTLQASAHPMTPDADGSRVSPRLLPPDVSQRLDRLLAATADEREGVSASAGFMPTVKDACRLPGC